MDRQKLYALLQKPEGTKLDFKAQLSLKTDSEKKEMAKDVAAIANSKGGRGYIVFGIEDGTKKILGIEGKRYTEEQIQQIISQRCDPPVSVKLDIIPHAGIRLIDKCETDEVIYFSGSITRMLDEIENYLELKISGINKEYPIAAVVEAIANAAVHRDYFSIEREIVVLIENSKIEISNPGANCNDDDMAGLAEEYNPCRRNQWLYQRLMILDDKRRFLKTGTGVKRVYEAFKQHGSVKFINNEKRNLFKVVLPGFTS